MAKVEKSVDVEVPVRTAYNQWTQFESFPQFMSGVESVEQRDDRRLHWKARVAGKEVQWDAVITEQVPDDRVAWNSTSGAHNAGVVTFHRLGQDRTRVMLQLETEPAGMVEKIGDAVGLLSHQVGKDLERFKEYIEAQGRETGAWRGEVPQSHE